ncbi:MAG: DegT/DnrJ/EryC1/StrS family aminotransferase [Candidatus Aenigmatarchaeota archaeon]
MRIPLSKPVFNKEMEEAAIHALRNEKFVLGESVFKFEEEFAKYCGSKYGIAVSSGTAALKLSLQAINVNGERVLTTPNSFITTSNSILYAGGIPVFSDIEPNTGNINLKNVEVRGVKAIIPVHLYGQPVDMDIVLEKAGNNAVIIEDACQAHGAEYKNKKVGSIGLIGCFSFYPSKNMTVCGDGGMVVTNDEEIAETIRSLRDCGRKSKYEHDKLSYTYRMNTVNAAIGRVQLRSLDKWNEKRRRAAKLYRKLLPKHIQLEERKNRKHVYHMFVIKDGKRDEIIKHLAKNNIQTGVHYPLPIHLQPIYKERFGFKEGMFPIAESFCKEVVSLPLFPEIKKDEIKFVCEKVLEVIE